MSSYICFFYLISTKSFFHIFLKWFEKLIFWNRVNSIKAQPCTYYKKLLSENIDFIFELFMESVKNHDRKLKDVLLLQNIKNQFKNEILLQDAPKNNGDYFQHTERIKDLLFVYLESLLFWILSVDRTQKDKVPFLYISSSMFLIGCTNLIKQILLNIVNLSKNRKIYVKVVTKNTSIKTELIYKVKGLFDSKKFDIVIM